MILSDSQNQPLALAIYAVLGIVFGIIYMLNNFTCSFLIKNAIYRHISQILYVVFYGVVFLCVTVAFFNYDLKIYHILISVFFTTLIAVALFLPIRKYRSSVTAKCDQLKNRVMQSKAIKRFKK